jgi:hypothetical protein
MIDGSQKRFALEAMGTGELLQRPAINPRFKVVHAAAEAQALGPTLLLQLLYPMVVIIGDCSSERHRSRHPDLGKENDECISSFRGDDMVYDATFVACIRKVRDDLRGSRE